MLRRLFSSGSVADVPRAFGLRASSTPSGFMNVRYEKMSKRSINTYDSTLIQSCKNHQPMQYNHTYTGISRCDAINGCPALRRTRPTVRISSGDESGQNDATIEDSPSEPHA